MCYLHVFFLWMGRVKHFQFIPVWSSSCTPGFGGVTRTWNYIYTALTSQVNVVSVDMPPLLGSVAFRETKAEVHSDIQGETLNN